MGLQGLLRQYVDWLRRFWSGSCNDWVHQLIKVGPRRASCRASYRNATYDRYNITNWQLGLAARRVASPNWQLINKWAQRRQYCSRCAAAGAVMRKLRVFWLAIIGGAVGGRRLDKELIRHPKSDNNHNHNNNNNYLIIYYISAIMFI